MVRPARLERATSWFVARRSIQLSYGRGETLCAASNVPQKLKLYHSGAASSASAKARDQAPCSAAARYSSFITATGSVRAARIAGLRLPATNGHGDRQGDRDAERQAVIGRNAGER